MSGLILIGRGLDQKYRERNRCIRGKRVYRIKNRESLRNQRLLEFIKIDEVSIKFIIWFWMYNVNKWIWVVYVKFRGLCMQDNVSDVDNV